VNHCTEKKTPPPTWGGLSPRLIRGATLELKRRGACSKRRVRLIGVYSRLSGGSTGTSLINYTGEELFQHECDFWGLMLARWRLRTFYAKRGAVETNIDSMKKGFLVVSGGRAFSRGRVQDSRKKKALLVLLGGE